MTRTANARLAGFTFLLYIVAGITSLSLTAYPNARSVLGILCVFAGAFIWSSTVTWVLWFPMLIFEVALAFWLLINGVAWRHAPQHD